MRCESLVDYAPPEERHFLMMDTTWANVQANILTTEGRTTTNDSGLFRRELSRKKRNLLGCPLPGRDAT